MALVSGGLRFNPPPTDRGGSNRDLLGWGLAWGRRHGFELTDEVAGEIGFLYWHAGARTSKNRDADHLVQHAREHGREIGRAPKAEPEEEVTPFDWETEDAKTRAGVVNRRARKF